MLLDGIEVRQDRGDIIGFKNEFGHVGMTDGKALRERFRQPLDRILAGQGVKRRRSRVRAFPDTGNGVAARASACGRTLTPRPLPEVEGASITMSR